MEQGGWLQGAVVRRECLSPGRPLVFGLRAELAESRGDDTYIKIKGPWNRFLLKILGSSGAPKKLTMVMSGANKVAAAAFVEDASSEHQPIEIHMIRKGQRENSSAMNPAVVFHTLAG